MKKQITLYLDTDLTEEITEIAEEQWMSRSGLINKLLEDYINKYKKQSEDMNEQCTQETD